MDGREKDKLASDYAELEKHAWGRRILEDLRKQARPNADRFSPVDNWSTHGAAVRDGMARIVRHVDEMIKRHKLNRTGGEK